MLSIILMVEAGLLLLPMAVALIYKESPLPFLITIGILAAVSLPGVLIRPKNTAIYIKDGFVCVAGAWVLMSAFGALPFMFSGAIPNFIDAFFETASGFTTTGASILTAVEPIDKSILFWRSFTHWVGGMGVLVFVLAILPNDDGHAINLLKAEVPGPTKGKLVPKLRQTARILYGIYFVITIIETVLLCCVGMPLYDSLVNSFATAGTGGFAVKNASIGGYANPAAEWIITIFMFLCGINFNMYYFLLIRQFKDVWKSEELRAYFMIYFGSVALITVNTLKIAGDFGKAVRDAAFQAASIISTTGFATLDYDAAWPEFSKAILVLLTITGACAGSTAGGLKVSRLLILMKNAIREIKQALKPNSVNVVRMDGEVLPDETVKGASGFFVLYFTIIVLTTLMISIDGYDLTTNITATLTCINNVGPGFGAVGPAGNFSGYSDFSTAILSITMLLGRLEIMPMLILLSPSTWRRRRS